MSESRRTDLPKIPPELAKELTSLRESVGALNQRRTSRAARWRKHIWRSIKPMLWLAIVGATAVYFVKLLSQVG